MSTTDSGPSRSGARDDLSADFAAEDAAVRSRRFRRRLAWGLLGAAAVVAAAVYVVRRLRSQRADLGTTFSGAAGLKPRGTAAAAAGIHSAVTPAVEPAPLSLRLESGAACLSKHDVPNVLALDPHRTPDIPYFSKKCGDDSFFIASHGLSVGIADGVGGWASKGVDPSIFANHLMQQSLRVTEANPEYGPVRILKEGFNAVLRAETVAAGSSTACLAVLVADDSVAGKRAAAKGKQPPPVLEVSNLGDSGVVHVRNGKSIDRAEETNHRFNFPFQLGVNNGGIHGDHPQMSARDTFQVAAGDLLVFGSDGLFDNLSEDAIAAEAILKEGEKEADVAARLVVAASTAANKPGRWGKKGGVGGKVDDITVLVSSVVLATKAK